MENKQSSITPAQVIEIVLRRRWFILIPLLFALPIGIYLMFTLPQQFEAKTLILVQPQKVPEDYVRSLVDVDLDARISTLSQQILSRTNLEKIIDKFQLFSGPENQGMFIEDKIEILRRRITVDVIRDRRRDADAFSISFKGEEPRQVMQIVNTLASYFIDENLKLRENQAVGTSTFLEDELVLKREQLSEMEEALKEFRQRNIGELPEQLDGNLKILEQLQLQLSEKQSSLRETKISLSQLENQIATLRSAQIPNGDQNANGNTPGIDITEATNPYQLRQLLKRLKMKYTDQHPDVIQVKDRIAELEAQQNQEDDTSIDDNLLLDPTNPLLRQRDDLMRDKISFENEIAELIHQIEVYKSRVENTPKREQELISLQRDYDNIKESYNSLLNRKLEADLAVNMERKQKGEQFQIIDPARLPSKPVEPDMNKLLIFTIAFGLGLGGGLTFLLEYMDTSFRAPNEVESYLEIPVIGSVPNIYNKKELTRRRLEHALVVIMILVVMVLMGALATVALKGPDQILAMVKPIIKI